MHALCLHRIMATNVHVLPGMALHACARVLTRTGVLPQLRGLRRPLQQLWRAAAHALARTGAPRVLRALRRPLGRVLRVALRLLAHTGVLGLLRPLRRPARKLRRAAAWVVQRWGLEVRRAAQQEERQVWAALGAVPPRPPSPMQAAAATAAAPVAPAPAAAEGAAAAGQQVLVERRSVDLMRILQVASARRQQQQQQQQQQAASPQAAAAAAAAGSSLYVQGHGRRACRGPLFYRPLGNSWTVAVKVGGSSGPFKSVGSRVGRWACRGGAALQQAAGQSLERGGGTWAARLLLGLPATRLQHPHHPARAGKGPGSERSHALCLPSSQVHGVDTSSPDALDAACRQTKAAVAQCLRDTMPSVSITSQTCIKGGWGARQVGSNGS